jgi:hypothetical protein
MRTTSFRTVTSALAVLAVLLIACGEDGSSAAPDAAADDQPDGTGDTELADDPDPSDGADDLGDGADATGDAPAEDDGDTPAGTAVVTIGDERYETTELTCPDSISGVEFFGTAEGPRDNARIHGRFGSSLPELIGVAFARGDEGEWAAVAENEVLDRGVLEDYTFDEDALTFSGTATFVWVEGAGLQDPDSLTDGTFEVRCG